MFYYFKDKHKLLEVKLEFKGHNYMFKSYEMELYSVALATLVAISGPKKGSRFQGPPLQTPLVMDYSPIQIHMSRPI
jgi:hypothetical protein